MDSKKQILPTQDKPHYHGHRKRLKERFVAALREDSSNNFPDYEVLELLLFYCIPRRDVKQEAKNIIVEFGSLSNLLTADVVSLENSENIPASFIPLIKLVNESSVRMLKEKAQKKTILTSWQAVLDYCKATMGYESKEQFRVIFLDQKNRIIKDEVQQKGTIDETPIFPREVVKRALELNASSLILTHNHPSGDPSPSKADIEVTENVEKALDAMDIRLHDHLIIAKDDYFSFASNGLIG